MPLTVKKAALFDGHSFFFPHFRILQSDFPFFLRKVNQKRKHLKSYTKSSENVLSYKHCTDNYEHSRKCFAKSVKPFLSYEFSVFFVVTVLGRIRIHLKKNYANRTSRCWVMREQTQNLFYIYIDNYTKEGLKYIPRHKKYNSS